MKDYLTYFYKKLIGQVKHYHKKLITGIGFCKLKKDNNKPPTWFGHSIMADGYRYKEGKFMNHTNQGQSGPTDSWYNFYKGTLRTAYNALRIVYPFKPY